MSKPKCPTQAIVDLFNATIPEFPRVMLLTKDRIAKVNARWNESDVHQDLSFWAEYFALVRSSEFLMGNTSDYETWALEVPGVTRAWVRPKWMGPGTVGVFIVRDGDLSPIPGPEALAHVLAYIEAERPVTAEVAVLAPVEKPIQYVIKLMPDSGAIRQAVEAELVDLHSRESELGGTLLNTHIREAISGAAGEIDHALLSPAGDVVPAANELPTFGGIAWR